MSEIEEGTPDNGNSPDTGTDVDWQKRYTDTQAEYTRQQQALKDEQAVWENQDAVLARIAEKFPDLIANEDDEDDDDDDDLDIQDAEDPRIAELLQKAEAHDQWIAQQAQEQAMKQFHADLDEEAGDRTLSRQAKEWIFNETVKLGDGRENLKKAFASWVEFEDSLGEQYLERVKKSKKAPHIQTNGQTATGTKPIEDMSRAEHNAWMVEQAMAREHQ